MRVPIAPSNGPGLRDAEGYVIAGLFRPRPGGAYHTGGGIHARHLCAPPGKLQGEAPIAPSDIEDATTGRGSDLLKDKALFKLVRDSTERAFAPGRIGSGQSFQAPAANRILVLHGPTCGLAGTSAPFNAETIASMSSLVVSRPRLKRIAPMPTSGVTPMASSTGDRSTRPE